MLLFFIENKLKKLKLPLFFVQPEIRIDVSRR